VNDYYEEPIALIGHDGFWEGGQLLVANSSGDGSPLLDVSQFGA